MEISLIETAASEAEVARQSGATAISEPDAKALLRTAGIPVPQGRTLSRAEDATDAALAGLRPPMVAKVMTPDGAHKSDFGGVRLGLRNAAEVRDALDEIAHAATRAGAAVTGFLVEEQCAPGLEMVIGGFWDPRLGPCVMIGLGGVFVEVFDDVAVDVGEAEVAAGVAVGELFVIDAEQVEDGGVEVVDVHSIFNGVESDFVSGADDLSALDASAGHPHGEAGGVVVASVTFFGHGGAAKFSSPDDQCIVQKSSAF